jgi:glycosyltransferase involved in cell wall biosynthesis
MDVAQPEISVVVATRDRSARLAALLASLRGQTLPPERFEVVVIDDASADDTPAVVAAEQARGVLALTSLSGAGDGPGAARNTGIRAARGGLVAFVDDDCEAEPGWLAGFVDAWSGSELEFLQGQTTPIDAERHLIGPCSYTYDIRALDLNFPTCNIAYPRTLLLRLNGFDWRTFPRAAGEDTELAWRAIAAGAEPRFAAEARAQHAVVQIGRQGALRRAWRWGDVVPAYARYPELRRQRLMKRVFFNWSHWYLLRLLVALALPRARALWPLKVWLGRRYFEDRRWEPGSDRPSARALAWNLVVDSVETAAMVRGSLRHGTLVL